MTWLCFTHLRHTELSKQIADMIVRPPTINIHYIYPCKLKGPEKTLRKYNFSYTWWWILDLSKTLCWRKRRVMSREKRCGESKLLCKRIFCYDLTRKPQTIYCQLLSAQKYIQRAQNRTVRVAHNLLISGKKTFFRKEGVWFLCCLETIWSTEATKEIPRRKFYRQCVALVVCTNARECLCLSGKGR